MTDDEKTPAQLLDEVRALRQRVQQLEADASTERTQSKVTVVGQIDFEDAEQVRLATDRLPLAYIVLDTKFFVRGWNLAAERTFGYSRAEAIGRDVLELIVPYSAIEHVRSVIGRLGQGDMNAHSVNENRTKDGRTITCEWFNTPISGPKGEFGGVICLTQDVTERRRTEQALERFTVRLQNLSRRLVEVREMERRHLASELHDELGQTLTGLLLLLKTNGDLPADESRIRLEHARTLTAELLEKVREMSFDLRPASLDQLGLVPALLSLFQRFAEQTKVVVNFRHQGLDRRFPMELETAAFRVIQEALTNVARHGFVTAATVRAWATDEILGVVVEDQGCGFDQDAVLESTRSGGLAGMGERARLLGGQFNIESRPGAGVHISAEFPLDRRDGEE